MSEELAKTDLERRVSTSETRINNLDRSVADIKTEQTRQGTVLDGIAASVSEQTKHSQQLPQPGFVRTDSIIKVLTLSISIIVTTAGLGWTITSLIEQKNKQADEHSIIISELRDNHLRALENMRDKNTQSDINHLRSQVEDLQKAINE